MKGEEEVEGVILKGVELWIPLNTPQHKCGIHKRSSHVNKDGRFWRKLQCHYCKKFGHLRKDYRFKNNQQANFSEEQESEGNLFYACQKSLEKRR